MALGASGVISVASNVAPQMVSDMTHFARDGEWNRARELHYRLLPLFTNLFVETNPIPAKTALHLMGKISGSLRLPLTEMEPANLDILKKTLSDLGLI
jgi:4-hydroxy-tetrahydrodipicolinate synthase